jgi:hypothetical protein
MRIYRLIKGQAEYKDITAKAITAFCACVMISSLSIYAFLSFRANDWLYISDETRIKIIAENDEFCEEKLKECLAVTNIKFPEIVYAQMKLETGNFKSKVFRENNNLFGMKVAKSRPTTNKGKKNGHAVYHTWRESVIDYAIYSAKYLSDLKTEEEYLAYLKKNYSEDPNYIKKVMCIVKKS